MDLFVTCPQGIEPLLCLELQELGFTTLHAGYRGVYVNECSFSDIYKINYRSRLASRVLLPIHRFLCYDKNSLYREASKINWLQYIPDGKTIAIDGNVNHEELRNSLYAVQVVKDAICDQLREKRGRRPNVETSNPDVQLNLFIHHKKGVISFDTSGMPLNKRGYRQESVEAPLQETMAAALLKIAEYKGDEILLDPCCGSGTLLIEAALMSTHTPPGFLRQNWGFSTLPNFDNIEFLKIKNEANALRIPLLPGRIFGSDKNKLAVFACKANLRATGFHKEIPIEHSDFRDYVPEPKPNFVITNPPHGNRLDSVDQLRSLYRDLGKFLKEKTENPSKAFIFVGNLELAKEVGLAPKKRHVLNNSGVDSRLLEFDLF